jgi:hypothetical protein
MLETSLCNATDPHQNCAKVGTGNHLWRWVGIYAATPTFARNHGFSIDQRAFLEARGRRVWNPATKTSPIVAFGAAEEGMFPAIQDGSSLAPGYYVSTTSGNTNIHLNDWDQNKYVDATLIPYAAHAAWWVPLGVNMGDFGVAINGNTGAASGFVFGDTGTGLVGEISRELFETLTPERHNEDYYLFLVFPGSGATVSDYTKFNLEPVVQGEVKKILKTMDATTPADEPASISEMIAIFLALNADRARYTQFRAGRLRESDKASVETDARYQTILNALQMIGW